MWVDAAARRLENGGWLTVIHRVDRLPDLLAALPPRLGSVVVLPLQSRPGRAPGRVLLWARKGGRAPFALRAPFVVHEGATHRDGDNYTAAAAAVLRDGQAIPWR